MVFDAVPPKDDL